MPTGWWWNLKAQLLFFIQGGSIMSIPFKIIDKTLLTIQTPDRNSLRRRDESSCQDFLADALVKL
jgi:hypothetical protein